MSLLKELAEKIKTKIPKEEVEVKEVENVSSDSLDQRTPQINNNH